uniref:Uncharacterized protein n=1 Tax=Anguilla anguilla TaxID=7936 RepID=A0A0E9TQM1_ANGAN
MYLVRLMRSR